MNSNTGSLLEGWMSIRAVQVRILNEYFILV